MRTLMLCALCLATFIATSAHMTRGFQRWTFEAVRRHDASRLAIIAPPTALETASGQRMLAFPGLASGRAPVQVVDFVYTRCETVCSVLGIEFHQMQEQIRRSRSNVRLLSISVDPVRDGAAELARYGRRHRADAAHWTLARPESVAASTSLHDALGVIVIPDGFGGFVHNGALHVFDGQHRLRAIFDYSQWQEALNHAERLSSAGAP